MIDVLAIDFRTHPAPVLEGLREGELVLVADVASNRLDRVIGVLQQLLGILHAELGEVLLRRDVEVLLEEGVEITPGEVEVMTEVGHITVIVAVVFLEVVDSELELVGRIGGRLGLLIGVFRHQVVEHLVGEGLDQDVVGK